VNSCLFSLFTTHRVESQTLSEVIKWIFPPKLIIRQIANYKADTPINRSFDGVSLVKVVLYHDKCVQLKDADGEEDSTPLPRKTTKFLPMQR